MPFLASRGGGSVRGFGRFSVFRVIGFTSTTTWTVPGEWSGTWRLLAIGGGGGAGGQEVPGNSGGGGGSGFKSEVSVTLSAGQSISINIGGGGSGAFTSQAAGNGGPTTVVRSGVTLITANGGSARPAGTANGGNGGSGGGDAADGGGQGAGLGGYNGSNGQNGANGGSPGSGQLGVAFGNGTDLFIPPGGAAGYRGLDPTAVWLGVFGIGSGNGGFSNTSPTCRGGGGGGGTWAQSGRAGSGGMVVFYG